MRCIVPLHVDSEQEGGWSPETVGPSERVGVGGSLPLYFGALHSALHVCTMK